jgi:hypothetical protein
VTVAREQSRPVAARVASAAYTELVGVGGEVPRECRVVSAGQLIREYGERGARRADADIARRADPSQA